MLKIHVILVSCILILLSSGFATAAPLPSLEESFKSVQSVAEGVDFIQSTLENQGFEILLTVDHQTGANSIGRDLRPTQVIFAHHPKFDRQLIRKESLVALDLPHKFLVFEDEQGEIQLRFNPLGLLSDRHALSIYTGIPAKLESLLTQFGRLEDGIILVQSDQSVEATVESLRNEILSRPGFRIPAVINMSGKAPHAPERSDDAQLIIFGNPNVGTPLMQNDQSIGLDLPQKFLVFQDKHDGVLIAFNDPRFLAKKHNLQRDQDPGDLETRLNTIANALRGLTQAGAQP